MRNFSEQANEVRSQEAPGGLNLDYENGDDSFPSSPDSESPRGVPLSTSYHSELLSPVAEEEENHANTHSGSTGSAGSAKSAGPSVTPAKVLPTADAKNSAYRNGPVANGLATGGKVYTANGKASQSAPAPAPAHKLTRRASNGGSAGSICWRSLRLIMSVAIFVVFAASLIVLLMEVKDPTVRRYVDRFPAMDTFRHQYYGPSRRYVLGTYQYYIGRRY